MKFLCYLAMLSLVYNGSYSDTIHGSNHTFHLSGLNAFPDELHPDAETLIISNSSLHELNVKSQFSNLKKLILRYDEIYVIQPEGLVNVSKLVQLDLHGNKLTTLYRNTFDGLMWLENLNLGNNQIRDIDESIWQTLVSLKTLDLSNNFITILSSTFLINNPKLGQLYLESNPLIYDHHGPILQSPSLQYLYLQGCNLTNLSPSAFSKLPNLNHLDLSANHLQFLPEGLLEYQRILEFLDIRNNNITQISSNVFHIPLFSLGIFDCEGNPLEDAMNCEKVLRVLIRPSGHQEKGSSNELDKKDDSSVGSPLTKSNNVGAEGMSKMGQEGKGNALDNNSTEIDQHGLNNTNASSSGGDVEKHGVVEHNENHNNLIYILPTILSIIVVVSVLGLLWLRRRRTASRYQQAETEEMP